MQICLLGFSFLCIYLTYLFFFLGKEEGKKFDPPKKEKKKTASAVEEAFEEKRSSDAHLSTFIFLNYLIFSPPEVNEDFV